jgi:omega-hydroxy-beta-dihydromenaquinone-9 sulfotransferase
MPSINENVFDIMYEPLAGSSLTNLLRLTAQNKFHISFRYFPRFSYALLMSSILTPFRFKESLLESKNIHSTKISEDPIFIIGHWRSGTTYLHNVLSLNTSFGYCSTFHATLPHVFLQSEKLLKPLLSASIPSKRPMDNAAMGPDLPQEEEYAIANIIPDGYYNGWCFPNMMDRYLDNVLIDEASSSRQKEWMETYLFFIKKLTYYHQGKQLLLKNPSHTARLLTLKKMFPRAKFVHITRNPYEVYYSMKKFMSIVLPRYCVQRIPSSETMKQKIFSMYTKLYQSYLKQRSFLSSQDLIEISYESFITDPLSNIHRIYDQFNLQLNTETENGMQEYLSKQKTFKRSDYVMTQKLKKEIYDEWKFAFDSFHYSK